MINESLKNAFKEMWKNNLNLLDISKLDLNLHIHDDNPHHITPYMIGAADSDHTHSYAGSAIAGGFANGVAYKQGTNDQARNVWFSQVDSQSKLAYDNDFKYNPATNVLTVGSITGTAEKAKNDGSGNNIVNTYATKAALSSVSGLVGDTSVANQINVALTQASTYTNNEIAKLIDSAPSHLDTLNKLATALSTVSNKIDNKANANHTHNYAGSSSAGGSATSAVKLDSSAGSATNPIYFSNGKPTACTYTLGKSVPSDAKFTDTTYSNATTSTDGLMSSSDKTKLNGIAAGATKTTVDSALSSTSTNPVQNKVIYGAISSKADLDTSGKVLSSQLPSYVDDVLEYSAKSNFPSTGESGKIYVDTATNLTYRWSGSAYVEISQSLALGETSSTAYRGDRGKIAYDHSQISHAPTNAEVNQNAFSNVKVGSTTVSADSKTDTLELVAGTNVTLTPDATNDKVTIATNDTKNTAGSTNTNDKIFLVGATSQAANPQTYSHDTAYVGTDGCLYSNNTKVSVNGHTHTVANISDLTATATELNYCDGVTSNIQTQLNNTVKLSGDQTINGNKTFTGMIYFDDPDASIKPYLYTDYSDALKINVGGKLSWIDSDGHFHSSIDGRFIGANTLSTYGVTGVKGSAESSYRKGEVNITPANLGIPNARNITISTADPTSSDGGNGDVWIKYGNAQSDCPFPVGGIYISIASTDPSSIWAGTTWEQFAKGRTLVGLNSDDSNFNTIGQTGGEKTHTLTTSELPAHGHGMAHTHSYTGPNTGSWKVGTGKAHTWCTSAGGKTSGGASKSTTDNAGGGSAHNNLQPYIVVYMWKRVS